VADVYSLLYVWANCRPSELSSLPSSSGWVGEGALPKRKYRPKPSLSKGMVKWLDVDLSLKELSSNELRQVCLFVSGQNGYRLDRRLLLKIGSIFKRRGLLR
jgi:hypothetical protein